MYLGKVLGIGSMAGNPFLAYADSETSPLPEKYAITDGFSFVSVCEHSKRRKIIKVEMGYEGIAVASVGMDPEVLLELNRIEKEDIHYSIKSLFDAARFSQNGNPEVLAAVNKPSALVKEGKESAVGLLKKDMEYITYLTPGEGFTYLSTEDPVPKTVALYGERPEEIAESLYEWMDKRFVVFTAAALWIPFEKSWRLAVKNRY